MANKMVFHTITTEKSLQEIKDTIRGAAPILGGQAMEMGETVFVKDGSQNVQFAFTADFKTTFTVQQTQDNNYNIIANVEWSPNTLFWICLVVGIFVFGTLWIVPALFLFIDPTNAYQQFLFLVETKLRD